MQVFEVDTGAEDERLLSSFIKPQRPAVTTRPDSFFSDFLYSGDPQSLPSVEMNEQG